jgi:hypothetical protein
VDDLEVAAAAAAAAMQAMAELQQDEDSDEVGKSDRGTGHLLLQKHVLRVLAGVPLEGMGGVCLQVLLGSKLCSRE